MSTDTIESLKAEHTKLGTRIARLEQRQITPVAYVVDEAEIALAAGEHYAGIVLDEDGDVSHHLVLLPGQAENLTWDKARDWAQSIGGELPTRQEQALLFANLKGKFEAAWYWSDERHESDGSYAWFQSFVNGTQLSSRESYEGRARAVRRFIA